MLLSERANVSFVKLWFRYKLIILLPNANSERINRWLFCLQDRLDLLTLSIRDAQPLLNPADEQTGCPLVYPAILILHTCGSRSQRDTRNTGCYRDSRFVFHCPLLRQLARR